MSLPQCVNRILKTFQIIKLKSKLIQAVTYLGQQKRMPGTNKLYTWGIYLLTFYVVTVYTLHLFIMDKAFVFTILTEYEMSTSHTFY